jgi:hypothetical protein
METKKTPRTRSVKKTTEIIPEVKLQEPRNTKHYSRNSNGSYLWSLVRIGLLTAAMIWVFILWVQRGFYEFEKDAMQKNGVKRDLMVEHCKMMPEMEWCEKYTHSDMNHDPMNMSMNDMWKMLSGKTGSGLEKAFLEAMIPHHEWAIEMAKYLTGNIRPELLKMQLDIIKAQSKEIEDMKRWLIDWGYNSGSGTGTPKEKIAL